MSAVRAQTRQPLHLSIDPSPYDPPPISLSPDSPSPSSSNARSTAGTTPTSETSSASILYSVLCLHDFVSDDPDHLPFGKNEILDIVKEEDSGWWAAMRSGIFKVGWVPKAYVKPLTERMAERLRNVLPDLRVFEYEAEQLYASAPTDTYTHLIEPVAEPSSSPTATWDADWRSPNGMRDNVARELSRIAHERAQAESQRLWAEDQAALHHPTSPLTPIPQPPSAPLGLGIHKPIPPTPVDRLPEFANGERQRSNSSPHTRIAREKPSLARLVPHCRENSGPRGIDGSDMHTKVRGDSADKIMKLTGSAEAVTFHEAIQAQASTPWYLRPIYADQLELDKDGNVRMGTLAALVERLTNDFSGREQLKALAAETAFRDAFLMTFRTFTTADILFDMLVDKFRMEHPDSLASESQFGEWREKKLLPAQHRVLTVFTVWLEDHRLLEEEPHIATRLTDFLLLIKSPSPLAMAAKLIINKIERLTFSTPQSYSPNTPKTKRRKSRGGKVDLLRQDPTAVAEQLCLLEHKLYSKITPQECLEYAKKQTGDEVASLTAFCSTHDKLASWVKASILSNENLTKRANTVDFWIKVAEKCRNMNNFASMSALINALSSTVINRLHLTWAHSHRKPNLDALLKYNEPTGGFYGYRTLFSHAEGPCVPFIGMYLTDIIHIKDQFADDTSPTSTRGSSSREPLIYFMQRQRWYEVISMMLKFQSKVYPISESESTQTFFRESMNPGPGNSRDAQWFWQKSQEVQQAELQHADFRKGLEEAGF